MIRLCRSTSLVFAAAIFTIAAAAQTSGPAPSATAPTSMSAAPRPPHKPTNLKVLPENTDIRAVMHQYEADLGVHCSFCHVAADATTHHTDFASDDNLMKNAARYMIQMTADLNGKYLKQMPMRSFGDTITCGTCHRGKYRPPNFVAPPESEEHHPPMPTGAMSPPAAPGAAPATGSSR